MSNLKILLLKWISKNVEIRGEHGFCKRCGGKMAVSFKTWIIDGKEETVAVPYCPKCDGDADKVLSQVLAAPCEKARECRYASPQCFKPVSYNPQTDSAIPARRWINCWGYKASLGLEFIKELGIYHLPKCPCCGADLVKILKENLKKNSIESKPYPPFFKP